MINIIDLGVSNVSSVANMVKKVGGTPNIISDHSELNTIKSNKAILPGVGSFDSAMKMLNRGNWFNSLNQYIENSSNSILGICLGMQIMFNRSEEGQLEGLKWIDGDIRKFQFEDKKLKVPHMGWNFVSPKKDDVLFQSSSERQRFYFVHSFFASCNDKNDILSLTNYGIDFVSSVKKNNIYGVQFHPEKSHRYGMHIINNFINI
tara:strand:- start:730 stop:1344 length:615 start_codon:yes stop_codon:yes gene_type:complete